MSDEQAVICEVVTTEGRPVFDGLSRTYEIVRDGPHEGTRGHVKALRKLLDKPLAWLYREVILEDSGERVNRAKLLAKLEAARN